MPQINGINFFIDQAFREVTTIPNNISNPNILNGFDYSNLYDIVSNLSDILSKTEIMNFFNRYVGENIYIVADPTAPGASPNASWHFEINPPASISSSSVFYDDLPSYTLVGGAPTANPGTSTVYNPSTPKSGFINLGTGMFASGYAGVPFMDYGQNTHNMPLRRVLFHELVHGRTAGSQDPKFLYDSSIKYFVAEAVAADFENLLYRYYYNTEAVRVGHIPTISTQSYNPIGAFDGPGVIDYGVQPYGPSIDDAVFITKYIGNDKVEKIYAEVGFEITSGGTPYYVNNYIIIRATADGSENGILTAGGTPSTLLQIVEDGIAHDDVLSAGVLTDMAKQIDDLVTLGNNLTLSPIRRLGKLDSLVTLFQETKYKDIKSVIGISAELSAVNSERTGPHRLDSLSSELFIQSFDEPSLILGASGLSNKNVAFDSTTDFLRGSEEHDILISGTGSVLGAFNTLEGKGGRDILVGRAKADKLIGGAGDDIMFLSEGGDIIDGNPEDGSKDSDILVVSDNLGAVTIDLKNKSGSDMVIFVGGDQTAVKGIEIFVGNSSKSIFKGNNEGSIFVSGSGGAEFTLTSGDHAIGHAGVKDVFRVDTTMADVPTGLSSTGKLEFLANKKVFIGNFGAEDEIWVNGIRFDGNKVTTALWGETIAPDQNRDDPHNAYVLTGDSSYGTAYANPTFEVRGASYSGEPWGALSYADMQYRDVNYTATSDSGLGIINFFARGVTGFESGGSSASAGQTGYTFNPLTAADEQLMVVIDGFQNGFGGITFENDGLANFRPGVPDVAGDVGDWPHTQNFATNWGEFEPVIGVNDEDDIFDDNVDGRISPGGASIAPDDPRFNLGELAFGGWTVNWDDVLSGPLVFEGGDDDDYLYGGWASDEIYGGDGDDYIVGGPGDDLLDGGAGNDEIYGGDGNDTLLGGDGDDQLYGESGRNVIDGGDGDDIAYIDGWMSDFRIYRKLDGTVVAEHLYDARNIQTFANVETLSFYGGALEPGDLPMGTSSDDVLTGSSRADLLDGGLGNDEMAAGEGDDVYVVDAAGDVVTENEFEGTDVVRTSLASYMLGDHVEKLVFTGSGSFTGTGNDLDNEIVGGSGDDELAGGLGYDRFIGGGGSDSIDGGDDWDTVVLAGKPQDYSYSIDGLGVVTISDGVNSVELSDVESVEFSSGMTFEVAELVAKFVTGTASNDILLDGDDTDNVISGLAGDDGLRGGEGADILDGGDGQDTAYFSGNSTDYAIYYNPSAGLTVNDEDGSDGTDFLSNIEVLHFDGDNVTINVSSIAPLGTSGNDTIIGSLRRDRLYGLAGNDSLSGADGADILDGGAGNDTLDGGAGNDGLYGGSGNDTIVFGTGNDSAWDTSGDDSYVYEAGDGNDVIRDDSGTDAIILGSSITPGDVTFSINNDDIILNFAGGGSLNILYGLVEGSEIEEIRFDDSTVWNPIVRLQTPTSGNDNLLGTISADTISGGAGNDTIEGRQGDDTLSGNTGDDLLSGGAGDDIYHFALGDGDDIIKDRSSNDNYGSGGNDILIFGTGIAPIHVQVSIAGGRSLVLTISGTSDKVTLFDSLMTESDNIETVQFADTTVWTHADLMSRALVSSSGDDSLYGSFAADTISGGVGNDYILAREGDDIITGGTGNDNITGEAGNDTYYFNLGDGQDYISDFTASGSSLDAIVFGAGILPADVVVKQADNGWDLVLSITGTSDKITINDAAFVDAYRIEEIRFADSTVWTHADLMARAYGPKSTGDTYWGTSDADTISGGAGNDLIIASGGNDTLAGGTGNDTLYGDAGTDTVLLMGLSATYSMVTSGGFLNVTDNAPTVDDNDGTDQLRGVEKLRFGDNQEVGIVSPIILDLDGGGVTTVSAYVGRALYDMDGDGIVDITSWMGRGEGMLFLDRDGNGTLSNAGEFSFVNDVEGAASDLVGLRAFDSNGDGALSTGDNRFADFRIWHDGNGDGGVQDGEILTLGEAGVASLSLSGHAVEGNTALGDVAVLNTGSYVRTDGQTAQFIDAALTYFSGVAPANASGALRQQYKPLSRRQLDTMEWSDRRTLGQAIDTDWRYARNPIAHWPELGNERMWSGPSVMAIDARKQTDDLLPAAATPASSIDRQLAMMVQDMSAFGVKSAADGFGTWQRENARQFEFFA